VGGLGWMHICIGLPTWNRADVLYRTLQQLFQVTVPDGVSLEVFVVDNNSTDHTQDILKRFDREGRLRVLFEKRQGRSWALNRAISEAEGDYIIWIDDDILVSEGWLAAYSAAFRHYPRAGVFGGSIVPRVESDVPDWFPDALDVIGGVFGKCTPPEGEIDPMGPFLPFGGNVAVRLELQKQHLFDVRLGRQGGNLLADEEARMIRAVLSSGHTGRWVPEARVEHLVPASYLKISHIRRYYHDRGVSAMIANSTDGSPMLFGRPRWAWRQAVQGEIEYRLGRWSKRSAKFWLRSMTQASYARGVLRGRVMAGRS
jgi:glucosyl-dolichyl phosphate glucuronosyltransferase